MCPGSIEGMTPESCVWNTSVIGEFLANAPNNTGRNGTPHTSPKDSIAPANKTPISEISVSSEGKNGDDCYTVTILSDAN